MSGIRNIQQVTYNPKDLGLNGVTFIAARNSNGFGCQGFNQMRVHYEIVQAAATDLSFYLEAAAPGSSVFGRGRFGDIDTSGGVTAIATYYPHQFLIPAMATAANQKGYFDVPINEEGNMRLGGIIGTAAGATDLLTMWVTLGIV